MRRNHSVKRPACQVESVSAGSTRGTRALTCWCAAVGLAASVAISGNANAQQDQADVRYYKENGVTYRETTGGFRPRFPERAADTFPEAEIARRAAERPVYVPVTRYYWEPRWHGWWRPIAGPHLAYHLTPVTRWEARSTTPPGDARETWLSRVPVPPTAGNSAWSAASPRTNDGQLESGGHLAGDATSAPPIAGPAVAGQSLPRTLNSAPRSTTYEPPTPAVGGIARLEQDPPRYGNAVTEPRLQRR
ncbi:MAG: hypothetical protein KDA60_03805 [Planctomycetales bacterium]|nr:hypothetical protein [Planctomycetales bacterium]